MTHPRIDGLDTMADDLSRELEVGRVYTDEELGKIFGSRPYYLRSAGGMVAVRQKQSLLLITHTCQDASFEYGIAGTRAS